jgi:hypothetical protein
LKAALAEGAVFERLRAMMALRASSDHGLASFASRVLCTMSASRRSLSISVRFLVRCSSGVLGSWGACSAASARASAASARERASSSAWEVAAAALVSGVGCCCCARQLGIAWAACQAHCCCCCCCQCCCCGKGVGHAPEAVEAKDEVGMKPGKVPPPLAGVEGAKMGW